MALVVFGGSINAIIIVLAKHRREFGKPTTVWHSFCFNAISLMYYSLRTSLSSTEKTHSLRGGIYIYKKTPSSHPYTAQTAFADNDADNDLQGYILYTTKKSDPPNPQTIFAGKLC